MKLDIECMTSRVTEIRPAVPQSFWFLGLTLATVCAGRQQSNDLPTQLQQLKAEYVRVATATLPSLCWST